MDIHVFHAFFSHKLLKKFSVCLLISLVAVYGFAQDVEHQRDETQEKVQLDTAAIQNFPADTRFRIEKVSYKIKGRTIEALLAHAVPVDTVTEFHSSVAFLNYLKKLDHEFKNIRTIESVRLEPIYTQPDTHALCLVHLIIHTKDSFNFIMLPYPKYDSNSGFLLKLKMRDNNFIGTMQPFNFDLNYADNSGKKTASMNCNFNYPYTAGPFFASQSFDTGLSVGITSNESTSFNFGTTASFAYNYKALTLIFGLTQSFDINTSKGAPIGKKSYRYYFNSRPFIALPITITQVENFGALVYTPSFSFDKDWSFSREANTHMKGVNIDAGHSLSLGKVSWNKNFREGVTASISNTYHYNTAKKGKPYISLAAEAAGYISFLDAFGIYGRTQFDYNFNKVLSHTAGQHLRGILDRRIATDMSWSFNLDFPIKILDVDVSEMSGKNWTRFFGFEMHISPFLDFAFIHDPKTNKYFAPDDAWCSGGFELIVYPQKMRSIYVRASLGFDLRELKNVPGPIKLKGSAKRDDARISEIFIGIGLHY